MNELQALKKDVSVGEYDARSGLTLITLQRGRLMFNMGPPSIKRAVAAAAAATTREAATPLIESQEATDVIQPSDDAMLVADSTAAPSHAERQITMRAFRSGFFTGRSLFAEEAVYLVQRGALIAYEMEELEAATTAKDATTTSDTRTPLPLATLMARMVRSGHLCMPSLDVYAFLKDHKLHPRRFLSTADSDAAPPSARCSIHSSVFDVYKSITETLYVVEEIEALRTSDDTETVVETTPPVRRKKRKLKRLALIFRVVVRSFRNAVPRPAELRGLIDAVSVASNTTATTATTEENESQENSTSPTRVPVKLAVVNDDRSVVLLEVA